MPRCRGRGQCSSTTICSTPATSTSSGKISISYTKNYNKLISLVSIYSQMSGAGAVFKYNNLFYPGNFYIFWNILVPLSVFINVHHCGLRPHEIGLLMALSLNPIVLKYVLHVSRITSILLKFFFLQTLFASPSQPLRGLANQNIELYNHKLCSLCVQ